MAAERFCLIVTFIGLLCHSEAVTQECRPTGHAVMGPFYKPRQPEREVMCRGDPKFAAITKLTVNGLILDQECLLPVPNAKVEVWQANSAGQYGDSSQCRSTRYSDCRGRYNFTTIHPGRYRSGFSFRPSHIHYMVTTPDGCYYTLVTQLYFRGDPHLGDSDSCSHCNSHDETLITTTSTYTVDGIEFTSAEFDIVLRRSPKWKASCIPSPCQTDPTVKALSTAPTIVPKSKLLATTMTAVQLTEVSKRHTTPLSKLPECPNLHVQTSSNFSHLDYVFRIAVKRKQMTNDSSYFRAKLVKVYNTNDTVHTSHISQRAIRLACVDDCQDVCNSTLLLGKQFLLGGSFADLSGRNMVSLSDTSHIYPWQLVRKAVKSVYNSKE